MTKPVQVVVAMLLAPAMASFAAFMTSKVTKVQSSVAAATMLTPDEKKSCTGGRERLPEKKQAYKEKRAVAQ